MTEITIQRVADGDNRSLSIFKDAEEIVRRIRERAFGLSQARGRRQADPLHDWLTAEREICWPATELTEQTNDFVLSLALPGYEPDDVVVTATPHELIVHGKHETRRASDPDARVVWSDFRSDDVYRRVELPHAIDVAAVSATMENGLLKVTAAKSQDAAPTAQADAPAKADAPLQAVQPATDDKVTTLAKAA